MIINKEGKLFGKLSIIDLLAIILIVVMIVGFSGRFLSGGRTVTTSTEKIRYVIRVEAVRQYTVDALKKGGPVFDHTTKEELGKVVDVTTEPARVESPLADGTIARVNVPDEYNAYVTVEVDGKVDDSGYYTKGNRQIGAGARFTMNTKYAVCDCFIEKIL